MPGAIRISFQNSPSILFDALAADLSTIVPLHSIRMDDAGKTVDGCLVGDWIEDLSDCVGFSVPILQFVAHLVGLFINQRFERSTRFGLAVELFPHVERCGRPYPHG